MPRPLSVSLSRFSSAAAVCAVLAMAGAASAASFSWDPDSDTSDGADGGAGVWNATNLFWFNGASDVAWPNTAVNTDTAVFGGTAGTVSLGTPIFARALQFDVAGYVIDNGTVAANTLTLSGTAPAISVTNAGTGATISTIIAGTGWTKTGAGTLTLSGVNTFTGLTVNQGTVAGTVVGNFGAGAITLNGGGITTNETGQLTLAAAQIITIGANGGTIDNAVGQKLLLSTAGGLTGSGTLTRTASANNTLSNDFQISVANTGFTGAVILNGGVTEAVTNALGTGATAGNTVTINTGGELALNGSATAPVIFANALILNGGTFGGDNATNTYSGAIAVNGATNVRLGDFYQNINRSLNITGNLSGAADLTTINNGTTATNASGQSLTLNPTAGSNSAFTGALNVSGGNNVVFGTQNALTGGAVIINTNATQLGGVGFAYDFGATVPAFSNTRTGAATGGVFGINTTLAPATSLDLSTLGGGGMFLGSQTAGSYTAATLGADAGVYRLGGGTGTLTLPNPILNGANDVVIGDFRANGNGTVILGGANTFTGSLNVANGTVSVGSINSVAGGTASSNLGAPVTAAAGTVNLGSSTATGTLRYTGTGETTDRVINLAGTTGGGGIDQSGTGLLKFTSDATATGTGLKSLTLQGSTIGSGEFAGKIINSSLTLAKAGAGSWLLSASGNSVQQLSLAGGVLDIGTNGLTVSNTGSTLIQATSGNTTINGGVLTISALSATDGGNIGAASGATLTINANMASANAGDAFEIFSAANSTGVVIVKGTNSFTGNTFINSGVLQVSNLVNALGTGSTISIGNAASTGNTLRYTGAGETSAKSLNLSATTGAAILEQAGTGLLKFTGNVTATGAGIKALTLQGSTAGSGELAGIISDNSTTNKTSLIKAGTGTWTLSGANTFTGSASVNGGSLVLNGETGSVVGTTPLALNAGGTFSYLGKSTGSIQTLGALTVPAGQGTVSSTYGGAGNSGLIFASLARTAGASVNFISSGGANGSTNTITLTGQAAAGFINQGTFFNGTDYAYNSGTGAASFLRAPVYDTDANFVNSAGGATLGTTTAATHVQLNGAVTGQTTASIATLKLNGARSVALASGATLTVGNGGILATGGASTIVPVTGTTTVTSGTAEMSIRTDALTDSLTISSILAGSGGLTKSGAGTLNLNNLANTFTGNIFVNGGTLAYLGTNSSADPVALGAGAKTITLTNGGTISPTITSNPTSGTKSFVVGANGGTFNVATGVTFQLDDASQFSGTGDLTVTGAGTGTVFLNNQGFTFSGNVFVNSGTLKLGANSGVLGATTGRTVTVASGAVLDAQISNLPVGLVLNGTGISSAGALVNSSTTAGSFLGPVTINSGATVGGVGALALAGNVSGSGLTKVGANALTLSGFNSYGTTAINAGTVIFSLPTAFGQSGASVTAAAGTTMAAGYAIDQGFLGRIASTTTAFNVALAANSSNNLDFSAANLTSASLGATGAFTYTGTLTPNGTTYRLGGGGGTLTLANVNAVTGANDLVTNGNTILAAGNNYTGTTAVNAGTLSLATASSSSAITIGSAGTLQLGTGGTTGSLGAATLVNNGVLAYNHSDNITTDVFTGTGALAQSGVNRLTINAATTSINRLFFNAAGTVDIGAVNRSIGVDGGNAIQMNVAGIGTIDATGGGAISFGFANADIGAIAGSTLVINPVIQGANAVDFYNAGGGTVVLNGANTYSGVTNIQSAVLSVGSLNSVATNVALGTVQSAASNLGAPATVAAGTVNVGSGTTAGTLKYTGAGETTDRVLNFGGTTGAATLDQSGTGLLKFTSNLTATGAGSKTFTLQGSTAGSGELAGAIVENSATNKTALTKAGTGTWTLSGVNTYTGATAVNGGALNLTGTLGSTAITVGTAGSLNESSTGVIGGTAALATSGATTLAGVNTYTGATAINAGTLNLTGTLGSTAITVGTAGIFNESSTGVIGGTAALITNGATTLAGANTFTGAVTVNAGPLTITNSAALGTGTKTVTIFPTTNPTSNPSLRLDGSGGDITLPATMSFATSYDALNGTTAIANAAAIVNIAGNNTVQGNFTLTSGGGGTAFLSNAGTLTLSGTITPTTTTRSVHLRGNGNGVISGNMVTGSGAYTLTKGAGTGTWTLSGTNTYNGATSVTAGTLQFAKEVSLYNNTPASWTAANISVGTGATLAFNAGGTGEFTASDIDTLKALGTATGGFGSGSALGLDTANAAGGTFAYGSVIANTNGGANAVGLTKLGSNTLSLSGANSYTGPTNVTAGTLAIVASGSISGSAAIKVAALAALDVSGVTGGTFSIPASQILINDGVVKGNVLDSGTVGGSGNVDGTLTVLSAGTVSPGTGAGTLSIGSDFSLNSGGHLAIELGTVAGSDKIAMAAGTLSLGGALDVSLLGTFANNPGDVFTLILNGGNSAVGGVFSNVSPLNATTGKLTLADGHSFTIDYAASRDGGLLANDVTATLVAVPEPSSLAALLGGTGLLLALRRRRSHK